MGCISCARQLHHECDQNPCCCSGIRYVKEAEPVGFNVSDPLADAVVIKSTTKGRPRLSDEEITDPHSTGRKRAAQMFPIDKQAHCEWRGLKNCGGGKNPIIGCLHGLQQHVHHGPDKNPLKNEPENIHRLCFTCHNRWHYFNDSEEEYDPTIPHNPRKATIQETIKNEMDWKAGNFKHLTSKRWQELNSKDD